MNSTVVQVIYENTAILTIGRDDAERQATNQGWFNGSRRTMTLVGDASLWQPPVTSLISIESKFVWNSSTEYGRGSFHPFAFAGNRIVVSDSATVIHETVFRSCRFA